MVHTEPKSWTLLPPPQNGSMLPGRGANERKREIYETKEEYHRMNGLHTPPYPPDMFRLTPTHHGEGVNLEEEGAVQEYPGTEDEYEATF
ncbi:hypothetical protein Gotur_000285 [Gossypium turneri]